jgi:hypothetical protein
MNKKALLAAAASAGLSAFALAGPIGINFVDGGDFVNNAAADSLAPAESAGAPGYVQFGWNNLGRWGATVPLNDNTGASTGATTTWDSNNTWNDGAGTASPDAKLMNGYLDATGEVNDNTLSFFDNRNKPEVFVKGLAGWLAAQGAATYDVIIYTDGDEAGGRKGEYWLQAPGDGGDPPTLTGVDLTSHVFASDTSNFSGTYTQVPLSANTLATAGEGNYIVFTGVSADSFVLRTEEQTVRSQINALQIVPSAPVPEPASLGIVALAAFGLLARRRRR